MPAPRMRALLRFNDTVPRDPAIEAWFRSHTSELGLFARQWFAKMRDCGDDVREVLHDGCPAACVQDAGFAYVNVFRSHMNVGFFDGASLEDPHGLLEGTGKRGRHVKLRPGAHVDPAALGALIRAAYLDIRRQLRSE